MIRNRGNSAKQWSPEDFERFAERYPETRWHGPPAAFDRSDRFRQLWDESAAHDIPRDVSVVLTPGLFAECLPRCFRGARRAFETAGHRVLQTHVRTAWTVREQAEKLGSEILEWLKPGERFVWCAHSKGGLDALWALERNAKLRAQCDAALVVQVPVGYSWVVEKCSSAPASIRERLMGRLFRQKWFAGGVSEISRNRDPTVATWLETFVPTIPVLHAVSWSTCATSWIDSYHRQLNVLRPGHAHDGQFYLADQLLPATCVVCLPELDHAQPVLGGLNLDVGRLWRTLLRVAWCETAASDNR